MFFKFQDLSLNSKFYCLLPIWFYSLSTNSPETLWRSPCHGKGVANGEALLHTNKFDCEFYFLSHFLYPLFVLFFCPARLTEQTHQTVFLFFNSSGNFLLGGLTPLSPESWVVMVGGWVQGGGVLPCFLISCLFLGWLFISFFNWMFWCEYVAEHFNVFVGQLSWSCKSISLAHQALKWELVWLGRGFWCIMPWVTQHNVAAIWLTASLCFSHSESLFFFVAQIISL